MRGRNRNKYEAYGNVFFCTTTIVGFIEIFDRYPLCKLLIDDIAFYQNRGDYCLLAYVIMPNHFHLVVKTNNDVTISQCIGNLKRISSRHINAWLDQNRETSFLTQLEDCARQEPAKDCRIWKPRFDSLVITQEKTLRQKIEYIHNNPVKAGLVFKPDEWRYSSARNYRAGRNPFLPANNGLGDAMINVDIDWNCLGYGAMSSGKGS